MQDKQILGIFPTREADWLQSMLAKEGVQVASVYNKKTCDSGCSSAKEVWVHPDDFAFIQKIILQERLKLLEGLGANISLINEVFDDSREYATCPACGFKFQTNRNQCPDCELSFF